MCTEAHDKHTVPVFTIEETGDKTSHHMVLFDSVSVLLVGSVSRCAHGDVWKRLKALHHENFVMWIDTICTANNCFLTLVRNEARRFNLPERIGVCMIPLQVLKSLMKNVPDRKFTIVKLKLIDQLATMQHRKKA